MNKNLDAFDAIGTVDATKNYENQLNDTATDKAEDPIKTLYLMTQSTLDTVQNYAEIDSKGLADVVRAAVYMLNNTTQEQRNLAYESTKVIKKRRGRKPA